jgi:hypothetical protein
MTTKKISSAEDIFQIKVTLVWTKPPIWRRLLVPSSMTLEQLHDVLQIAMGWENDHMHDFSVGRRRIGQPDLSDGFMDGPPVENERTVRLSAVLGRVGAKMIYTYDFGDSWEHGIVLEKRLPPDPDAAYPICLGGRLACPPEDCGGIPGFYRLLDALANPKRKEHDELREWAGGHFDPKAFSVEKVNKFLSPRRPPGKK